MASDDFDDCLRFTLAQEGGFSNHPADPGGATQSGLTLASYRAWMGDPDITVAQLRAVTPDAIRAFYMVGYYKPLHCDILPRGITIMAFDHGVNTGVRRSAMLLQQAVGAAADGWIGPATLAAVQRLPVVETITLLADLQRTFYLHCAGFPTFGRGWLNRLAQRKATALNAAGLRGPPALNA